MRSVNLPSFMNNLKANGCVPKRFTSISKKATSGSKHRPPDESAAEYEKTPNPCEQARAWPQYRRAPGSCGRSSQFWSLGDRRGHRQKKQGQSINGADQMEDPPRNHHPD